MKDFCLYMGVFQLSNHSSKPTIDVWEHSFSLSSLESGNLPSRLGNYGTVEKPGERRAVSSSVCEKARSSCGGLGR
jgi:hypothetical protein